MREKSKDYNSIFVKREYIIGLVALYLLLYLAYFVVLFARYLHFHIAKSLIIGFARAEVEFKNINIIVNLSK